MTTIDHYYTTQMTPKRSLLVLEPVMLEALRFVFWGKLGNPSAISRV